jgi:hypothetical protein
MSDKDRQKKDHERKDKKNQRRRENNLARKEAVAPSASTYGDENREQARKVSARKG